MQSINCCRPLVDQEDSKHHLAFLNSSLPNLVYLHSWTQPCYVLLSAGNATERYPGLIFCEDVHHTFSFIRLKTANVASDLFMQHLHTDIFVYQSAYGVAILQAVFKDEALCGEFSELFQNKEQVLYLLLTYRCVDHLQ